MLHIVEGDLLKAGLDAIVNPCNTVGVAGRGLSWQIAQRYPETKPMYYRACQDGILARGGDIAMSEANDGTYVLHVATKEHWRNPSRIEWVHRGLHSIVLQVASHNRSSQIPLPDGSFTNQRYIHTLALPPLGAGLGGLDGREVLRLTREAIAFYPEWDVDVYYFLPR